MTVDIGDLRSAKTYQDLGRVFGVSPSALAKALYGRAKGYNSFRIAKKSGGHREIDAPIGLRRTVQEGLAQLLGDIYKPNAWAHGFVPDRSVATNAKPHVQCTSLINIDLEDFFPSITFQRVRGVFLSQPIGLNWFAANVLAQACTCQGRLPAGGIASPVLSNFILSKLDKALGALTARYGGVYTRYADDLTFSFNRPIGQLKGIASKGDSGEWEVGPALVDLITASGFSINPKKTRIRGKGSRKEVTGLIVNEKRNVPRRWLRDLEKNVYAVEKFGLASAAARIYPNLPEGVGARKLLRRLHGKISYLSMVRGRDDWVVAELAFRFNRMSSSPLQVPDVEKITQQNRVTRSVWTVFGYKAAPSDFLAWDEVGSAFVFERGLIVTAEHVLVSDGADLPFVYVTHPHQPSTRIPCDVIARDANRDVALLRPSAPAHDVCRVRFAAGAQPSPSDDVLSVGFPEYKYGGKHHVQTHAVSGVYTVSGVKKFSLTGTIVGGLSGGPILNGAFEVVGLVHRGAVGGGHANEGISVEEILKVVASV